LDSSKCFVTVHLFKSIVLYIKTFDVIVQSAYLGGLIFLKELRMLLVILLVISLVLLFVFSMSREKGKNTKFARKGANAMAQK
jgi:hypothetical protein